MEREGVTSETTFTTDIYTDAEGKFVKGRDIHIYILIKLIKYLILVVNNTQHIYTNSSRPELPIKMNLSTIISTNHNRNKLLKLTP